MLAAEAGADLREHDRVDSLDALDADRVVVATDGYPSGLLGELEGSIIPTRGQMIATEPLAERVFACPHYGRHGFDYWQQTPDGRVLAGGFRDYALDTEFTADETTTAPIQEALDGSSRDGRATGRGRRTAGPAIFGLVLDFLPVVGASRTRPRLGRRRLLRARQRARLRVRRPRGNAMLGEEEPLLELFRLGPPPRRCVFLFFFFFFFF